MDFFLNVHANYISGPRLGNVALINCSIIPDNHAMKRRNIYLPTWHLKFCRFQRSKDTICILCIPIYSDQESKNPVFIMPFHSSVYSMIRIISDFSRSSRTGKTYQYAVSLSVWKFMAFQSLEC